MWIWQQPAWKSSPEWALRDEQEFSLKFLFHSFLPKDMRYFSTVKSSPLMSAGLCTCLGMGWVRHPNCKQFQMADLLGLSARLPSPLVQSVLLSGTLLFLEQMECFKGNLLQIAKIGQVKVLLPWPWSTGRAFCAFLRLSNEVVCPRSCTLFITGWAGMFL